MAQRWHTASFVRVCQIGEMASPVKVPKEGKDAVEGFIHNVSPRKQSRTIDKQATFSQAEKNGNAVCVTSGTALVSQSTDCTHHCSTRVAQA